MKMIPVDSSNLKEVGYENTTNTLRVEFKNGGVYDYHNVPTDIFDSLMTADSHGQYFDRNIKKGGYRFTRIR